MSRRGTSVLVIGGGISGIQAALDLADRGHMVYLVEKEPSIGGHMAQLDKTFPTNDCSMCILAPKMVTCGRHPNIRLMAYSEVIGCSGVPGNLTVKILRKPRYVDESKCTGCGLCAETCPIEVPNEFDLGLGLRKAIYVPFPQAVPNVYTIDLESCIGCRTCEGRCQAKAIDFSQRPKTEDVNVGSIVLALGYGLLNPAVLREYGYGSFPNVITSLQFERVLSASGPTFGNILRPSDGCAPRAIAFIQCVGSRNSNLGLPYCSQVCCMYGTKQAIVAKEHDPEAQVYIFYIDLRAAGKGFQEYIDRAIDEKGVSYIKANPSEIIERKENGNLIIWYEDVLERKVKSLEVEMVVLCPAMVPSPDIKRFQALLNIDLDNYGYVKASDISNPTRTTNDCILVCGAAEGPKDIPDSVAQASGAASVASIYAEPVGVAARKNVEWSEGVETRVGVFVCNCGVNIGAVVNVPEVVEYAKGLPNVVHAEEFLFACSQDSIQKLIDAVKKGGLNRVVVASCTPRTHEPFFQSACVDAGLNPYLFTMANIRDQCSWVHEKEPDIATQKAKDLVRMAVAKSRLAKPLKEREVEVKGSSLVIGGGISGLTAALHLAEQGIEVHLVEKEDELGGLLRSHYRLFPNFDDPAAMLASLISSAKLNDKVHVYTSSVVEDVKGYVGNFEVTIRNDEMNKQVEVGTIILASGADPLKPFGLYKYGELENVITQSDLEEKLRKDSISPKRVVMIQCAGARDRDSRPYCSRICCTVAVKNSIILKERNPNSEIYILYRDLRTIGKLENLYDRAREMRVKFIKFPEDRPPIVTEDGNGLKVKVHEATLDREMEICCDHVVLSTPLVPSEDTETLSKMLKVPVDLNGFFLEAHVKLRPVDFATDGIFLCGTAHSPKSVADSVSQALAVASRASIPMKRGLVKTEAIISSVDEALCVGCETCVLTCDYEAPSVVIKSDGKRVSSISEVLCKGCGSCVAACPAGAVDQAHFTTEQILAQIEEALSGPRSGLPRIVAFLCNWCSYAGADLAGVSRFQYPPSVRIIRTMCSGRFDIVFALKAFLLGADGVLVCGCHPGDCHYISGNLKAERRVRLAKELLVKAGVEPERLRIEWVSAAEGKRFSEIVSHFTDEVSKLGPNPLGRLGG